MTNHICRRVIYLALILIAAILILSPITVQGNSGPIYMYMEDSISYPVMALGDSPIKVTHENLTFDMRNSDNGSMGLRSLVTANYQMVNPTEQIERVTMAFPIINTIHQNTLEQIQITADGQVVPYHIYIGESMANQDYLENQEQFTEAVKIETIVENLNRQYYATKFDDSLTMPHYKLQAIDRYGGDGAYRVRITFQIDSDQTSVIAYGINGYGMSADGTYEISTWVSPDNSFDSGFIVLGEDTVKNIQIHIIKDTDDQLLAVDLDEGIVKETIVPREAILGMIQKYAAELQIVFDEHFLQQTYIAVVKVMDELIANGQRLIADDMLREPLYRERIFVLVYDIEFPPATTKAIEVRYPMEGTIDRRNSSDYTFTFGYITNPAKGWADFGTLDIEVIPDQRNPYIISSSLPLERQTDGRYITNLLGLPEDDIVFTLYSKPEIDKIEKFTGFFNKNFGIVAYLMYLLVPFALVATMIGVIMNVRRKS